MSRPRLRRAVQVVLVLVVVLVLAGVAAVWVRLPPPATDLADPPRGELHTDADAGTWTVGAFTVRLEGGTDPRIEVLHPDAVAPVWETVPGESFLTAALGEAAWRDDFGLLRVADEHERTWTDQTVDDVVLRGPQLVMSGALHSDDEGAPLVRWTATLREGAAGRLDLDVQLEPASGQPPNRLYLTAALAEEERVHGFGGQSGSFDLRGRRIPLLPREQGAGRGEQPLSLLVDLAAGSAGGPDTTYLTSAVHVTSESRSLAYRGEAIASADLRPEDRMVWEVWDHQAAFSAVAASDPLSAVALHATWAGAAEPPPGRVRAGLVAGLQGGTEEIRREVARLQEAGVDLSAVWLQDWVGQRVVDFGARLQWNWTLDRARYPGWDRLVEDLETEGIRVLTYVNPFLSPDSGRAAAEAGERDLFAEAADLGHLVVDADGAPYLLDQRGFDAALVDLSSPDAREWLTDVLVDEVAGAGASGWMADFGEGPPPDAVLDGGSAVQWRARWPVLWQQVNREAMARAGLAGDGFVWHRSAHSASAGAADALWLGDQMQGWSVEDGLGSVPALLHASAASGMAQMHGDVGGYTSLALPVLPDVARDPELVVRWAEASLLQPVLRTHEGNRPEAVAQPAEDPSLAASLAPLVQLFSALEPEKQRLEAVGPLAAAQHHPWMHHPSPELVGAADHETMLGPDVLLVPVLAQGEESATAVLPPGSWTHVWSGKQYGDPAQVMTEQVAAPPGRPALFVRTGSAVAEELASFAATAPSR